MPVWLVELPAGTPEVELLVERLAAAEARHDHRLLLTSAESLKAFPSFHSAAFAAAEFAAAAIEGGSGALLCERAPATVDPAHYFTELSRLLERAGRIGQAADCLEAAAVSDPTPARQVRAARGLARAGRDEEAARIAEASDAAFTALLKRLRALPSRQSADHPEVVVRGDGDALARLEELCVTSYETISADWGLPASEGIVCERVERGLRREARLSDSDAEGMVGVALGQLVSVEAGLPDAIEREVVWHEMVHLLLQARAPFGGSPWLGEAVAFAESRRLLPGAEAVKAGLPEGPLPMTLEQLDASDGIALKAEERVARDRAAALFGSRFAALFGAPALRELYAVAAAGTEGTAAAAARVAGVGSAELLERLNRFPLSRPKGQTGL